MKHLKRTWFYFLLCLFSLSYISCSDDNNDEMNSLSVEVEAINFKSEKSLSKTIKILTSAKQWTAEVAPDGKDWCHITTSITRSNITVELDENNNPEKRSTTINITAGTQKASIKVEQLGYNKDILVDKEFISAKASGELIKLVVTANIDYEISFPEWIEEVKTDTRTPEMINYDHSFKISSNDTDDERTGAIEFSYSQDGLTRKVLVTQKGLNEYDGKDTEGIEDDIKIKIISGEASSFQPGAGIELAFDGKLDGAIYHSNWNNQGTDYFPITLTFNLEEGADIINYLIYYQRQSGTNGNFKETEIQAIYDNHTDFVKVMDFDFKGTNNPTTVTFEKPLVNPKSIRFIVKSGAGDRQGFAACAEMEFYKYNMDAFDPLSLFTDVTCSKLKEGITKEDISNCKFPFYQNLAFYMLNGKYETDFRIAEFKAYPHPDIQARINKTSTYSLLDNPTGIAVKANEEIVIFASNTHNHSISVRLQNLDKPGGDGAGGPSFPITTGVNKFKAPHKGLLYVMYHNNPNDELDTYKSYEPVKMHFASGSVNGYFDSTKHKKEDWNRLLNNTTSEYFDVLGKSAHLTFPVKIFKDNTPDGLKLINTFDEIVEKEWEFMGLYKYDTPNTPRVFRNRMYFNVMYTSYMYSTAYRTAYHVSTLPALCNESNLRTGGIWGPAHEVGHSNQTRPGLKWVGTTEVTNNIHSQYLQTYFGNGSRLQNEDMGEGRNRFENAMTNMFKRKMSHGNEEDVFCKLVPFWQLELYFNWVLGNEDIYKDIYEDVRLDPNKGTNGKNQVWFAVRASKAAKYDLTEFFEKWGFFTPVDIEIDDYGKPQLTVTKQIADEAKAAIQALGLPKPDHAIEYITDNTVPFYKDNAGIQKGTYTRNEKSFKTQDCGNPIAFEVYDNDKLIFVSSRKSFNTPTNPQGKVKVIAVSCKGEKIEISPK